MKRFDGESRVNRQPLQLCIQSQEEEIQPEEMDAEEQTMVEGPNPEIPVTQRMLSVGTAG